MDILQQRVDYFHEGNDSNTDAGAFTSLWWSGSVCLDEKAELEFLMAHRSWSCTRCKRR